MSRTARFAAAAAVFTALCAGALTTTTVTASAESGHHVGASAEASINWDTAPTSITDSINWD
ncbi:hypothetical protein [Streptomyces sp. NBC_01294]|uniref:hypothetical protein n=1 Tax=Streptomyces sp. NBC_01294 TaxID=2903815 RepID=UPI002DDC1FA1|nr:hypothetical protein [Streptomyces sp. NBC_01294]WRZ59163.1 hypothetical protein OG534_23375 [Streptomyces sp. NBC_01294]